MLRGFAVGVVARRLGSFGEPVGVRVGSPRATGEEMDGRTARPRRPRVDKGTHHSGVKVALEMLGWHLAFLSPAPILAFSLSVATAACQCSGG